MGNIVKKQSFYILALLLFVGCESDSKQENIEYDYCGESEYYLVNNKYDSLKIKIHTYEDTVDTFALSGDTAFLGSDVAIGGWPSPYYYIDYFFLEGYHDNDLIPWAYIDSSLANWVEDDWEEITQWDSTIPKKVKGYTVFDLRSDSLWSTAEGGSWEYSQRYFTLE